MGDLFLLTIVDTGGIKMEDVFMVSFSNKENFHKFIDVALDEGWECIVSADCEGIPMVQVSSAVQYGGPVATWKEQE